jgi:uncharacterized protein
LNVDPIKIILKYYLPESKAYYLLTRHSEMVASKSLRIARRMRHLRPDADFIREAAMLHDIGIFLTNEPAIGCLGEKEYICHGYLGREILDREGLPRHALVCERHLGVGLSAREIEDKNLPVPKRDMMPLSIEEQIICFADKFFSKDAEFLMQEKPLDIIRKGIARFGPEKLKRFDEWVKLFGLG